MSKIVICIQARMGSSRLPGKVLLPLNGRPVLWHVVERCQRSNMAHQVLVATTCNPLDDVLQAWCEQEGYSVHRGEEDDVVSRYLTIAHEVGADVVVRVTGDCPAVDPHTIDRVIRALLRSSSHLAHAKAQESYSDALPRGLNVAAFWTSTLERIHHRASLPRHREHVTLLVEEDQDFRVLRLPAPDGLARPDYRLTLDYPEDFIMLQRFFAECPVGPDTSLAEMIGFLDQHPEILEINSLVQQKELT